MTGPTRTVPHRAPPAGADDARRSLVVLIPCFNEGDGLGPLLRRLRPVLDRLDVAWRILMVVESRDDTLARIAALHADDPRIVAVSLSRNFGKEIAIAAGLRHADADAVVIMDADLQHPPEVIEAFVEKWDEGYDVVYGERLDRATDSPLRQIYARAFYRLYNALVETDIPENAGDFRLLSRRAVAAMNQITETARFNKGLFSWIGFKSAGVPFTVEKRAAGETRWSFRRLARFAIDGLTSFTTLPLRIWSLIGAVISLIAFVYALVFLAGTLLFGATLPGFPSLIVSVMLFSGIQLISLGVIGEYLGRVYEEVKARPLYIVADTVGIDAAAPSHGTGHTVQSRENGAADASPPDATAFSANGRASPPTPRTRSGPRPW
ncbi:MAG: glycosyltransferase family 2 protein [Pseudomonadota bacterium]